jgi:hypothetical protein
MMPMFVHPQAAVYGTSGNNPFVIVAVTELSAAAKKYGGKVSAASMRRGLLAMGIKDAQGFPAGRGVKVACGDLTRSGTIMTLCMRYDKKAVGLAVYLNGEASSLSDAAGQTSQAISASGG